jgi:tetratricopeptide (TPR) repeat protein
MDDHHSEPDRLEHALTLFHAGEWEQARQLLAPLVADVLPPEAAAVWGICETLFAAPLDLGVREITSETRTRLEYWLVSGEETGWPEVLVCQDWLQLCQSSHAVPETIPAALNRLTTYSQTSRWYPIWALAMRALVFYGQYQAVSELLVRAVEQIDQLPEGFRLVVAEAQLECGQTYREAQNLLDGIDVQALLPLSVTTADLWRAWLSAEYAWWSGTEPPATPSELQETLPPNGVSYDVNEWQRITTQAALWRMRYALGHGDVERAQSELDRARDAPAWKIMYLKGLLCWAQGRTEDARQHLGQSLLLNPHQTRVRFELDLLRSTLAPPLDFVLEPIPHVHDTLASTAAFYAQTKRFDAARHHLHQWEQPEEAYSRQLIWPQAHVLRLQQGNVLRAYLAEQQGDWETALNLLGEETPDDDLTRRAYRLYLLSRYLLMLDAPPKSLVESFHKELGKLSLRPLIGQAMFYRSLAAQETMPDRAIQDWRALLRQSTWVTQAAPEFLLLLGTHLLKAGLWDDAQRAYDRAAEKGAIGAEERQRLCRMASHFLFDELPSLAEAVPDDSLRALLIGLGELAHSKFDAAREAFEHARSLPTPLDQLGHQLVALATGQPEAARDLSDFWKSIPPDSRSSLPLALRLGLDLLCDPCSLQAMQRFKTEFGETWADMCPFDPADIVFRAVTHAYIDARYDEALAWLDEAVGLGLQIPDEWRALIHLRQAAEAAVKGNFEVVDQHLRRALDDLGGENGKPI